MTSLLWKTLLLDTRMTNLMERQHDAKAGSFVFKTKNARGRHCATHKIKTRIMYTHSHRGICIYHPLSDVHTFWQANSCIILERKVCKMFKKAPCLRSVFLEMVRKASENTITTGDRTGVVWQWRDGISETDLFVTSTQIWRLTSLEIPTTDSCRGNPYT